MATLGEHLDGILAAHNWTRDDVNSVWRWNDAAKVWQSVQRDSFWDSADQVQVAQVDLVKAAGFRFRVQTDIRGDAIYQYVDGAFQRIDENVIITLTPDDLKGI